ncbi:MAG: quinolinate synthase NadA [Candidatus Heimdallarchaeaceae archaeon]
MVITKSMGHLERFDSELIEKEVDRLHAKLGVLGWPREVCREIAPYTLRINQIKKERGIHVLAHSYQTPDIIFGIADSVGDSLGLSKKATEVEEDTILFCGVEFMAETAKILNPEKKIIIPKRGVGCTLADSITGEDVRRLKEQHPGAPVVCYVNTTAEVKAESDICCTSANAKKIIESLENDTIIFVPDFNMGNNLAKITGKTIITYNGHCRTHNKITREALAELLDDPSVISISHLECKPEIVFSSDQAGGTGDMHRFAKSTDTDKTILFVTEQGFIDRMKVEYPNLKFADSNMICPMMKMNNLQNILETLENLKPENFVELDEEVRVKAFNAVNNMLKY